MCIFQHVGKQDRTHARTNMVKIALRKLFAGILCGCVVLLVLVVKWVMEKTIQTHPYSNCIFHHQNSQRKQTNFKVPTNLIENFDQHNLLHVSLSACWKTGQNPCKNTHGENCIAQVVCWYFVRLCGAACWLRSEWWKKKTSKPIHILTALFTTGIHKEYKQVLPYRPTSWKPWPTSSTVRVSVTTFENRTGSMQEQILHCASCLLVFCVVEWCCWCCSLVVKWMQERNHPIISKPYSNCNVSQPGFTKKKRLVPYHPTSRKYLSLYLSLSISLFLCVSLSLSPFLHRYLGVRDKNVANIIYCTLSRQIDGFQHLFQHAGNQNRIHGTMQEQTLWKRCWYSAWLHGAACVGGEVSDGKNHRNHILTAHLHNQNSQEDKQVRTVQPQPLGKRWPL